MMNMLTTAEKGFSFRGIAEKGVCYVVLVLCLLQWDKVCCVLDMVGKFPRPLEKEEFSLEIVCVCVCWEMLHVMPLLHIVCCHPVTQSLLHVVPLTHRTPIFYFFANFTLEVKKFSVV